MTQSKQKVLLIYTGGTIGMNRNPATGALEPFRFEHLLNNVPELEQFDTEIETFQFQPPIDSSDMNPSLWQHLAHIIADQYNRFDGFVILHGTDTMAYTASILSYMFENLTKPIILTGSQLPIGQLRTDGKENLITSIEIASACDKEGHAIVPEVCIYFSGCLLRGNRTTKQSAENFHAFESFNYPHLANAGIHITYNKENILKPDWNRPMTPHFNLDANVIVFTVFPGIPENIVRHVLESPSLRAIVMRTYGSGNAPQLEWLSELLTNATQKGKIIINISQCMAGTVEMGRYGTGYHLKTAGVISGFDSTVESAVTKLMYLQGRYDDSQLIRTLMQRSIRGEISLPDSKS